MGRTSWMLLIGLVIVTLYAVALTWFAVSCWELSQEQVQTIRKLSRDCWR